MSVPFALKNTKLTKLILLFFLLMLIGLGAIPGYLKGNWSWQKPLPVTSISQMIKTRKNGLELPGWQTKTHQEVSVSNHKWLYQEIQRDPQTTAILLFRFQQDDKDQPQVEWVDLKGFQWQQTDIYRRSREIQRWQTDKYSRAQFTVLSPTGNGQTAKVEAQFFRGWNRQQTYAVLQWYAWYSGGNPDPTAWFWVDRIAQWQGHRVPWIAVSIQIPIEPLGEIEPVLQLAQSLGQTVQSALMAQSLQKN